MKVAGTWTSFTFYLLMFVTKTGIIQEKNADFLADLAIPMHVKIRTVKLISTEKKSMSF